MKNEQDNLTVSLDGEWEYRLDKDDEGIARRYFSAARFLTVDYKAKVWLNGAYLGSHEGYFNPFEFDITEMVRSGENNLVVRVDSPRDPTEYVLVEDPDNLSTPLSTPYKRHWAKDLTIVKGHLIDAMHRPGAMTKYRQDGNTGGIWQSVELVSRGPVQISYAKIYCKIVERDFIPDGSALVTVDLELLNAEKTVVEAEVELKITAGSFESDIELVRKRKTELPPGLTVIKLVLTVPEARLWWTWDHGEPNLYKAEICVARGGKTDDARAEFFGIKDVRHDEATGHWYLNGKRIFLRGMRYYSSMYMSEIDEERVKRDLDEMLGMKINSIRIGSHVEKDFFYGLCDRMGFLVWQNFPLHYCYSDCNVLIERACVMMRGMPNNYGRLCEALYETGKTVDPIRWMHKGDYQEGVQNLMTGCCQPGDLDMKAIRIEPNIVEFGSHALPPLESLKKIIPEKDLWPPNWDVWEYWGFFYDLQVRHTKLDLNAPSLEDLIERSQAIEAKTIKEQIEFLRQRKYAPVGCMYLYYWSDPAPVIGSGLVDYFGRKLPAYENMKSVYTPVLVSLEWNKRPYVLGYDKHWKTGDLFSAQVWVNNDHLRPVEAVLRWKLRKENDERTIMEKELVLTLAPDSAKVVDTIDWPIPRGSSGAHRVDMTVTGTNGESLSRNYFDFIVG